MSSPPTLLIPPEKTPLPDPDSELSAKGIQRARNNTQQVVLKLKGEARTRQAEAEFVEALRTAPVFAQVVLERETERAGGGWDFEISLPAAAVPPPFRAKPIKQGPATPVRASAPVRPPAAVPGKPVAIPLARPGVVPPPPAHPGMPVKPVVVPMDQPELEPAPASAAPAASASVVV